jgi:two-component system sensor histidine kinase/response regulator
VVNPKNKLTALRSHELRVAPKDCSLTTRQIPDQPHRRLNILLAEDNPVNRVLAQKLLQKQGHLVTSVNNGREALELWEKNQSRQFDIILMDVQMPEMDGLQATSRIREIELATTAHIPIIAVTAHAMKGDRERCLAAGIDAYITKPINPAELAATIRAAVPAETKLAAVPVASVDPIQAPFRNGTKLTAIHEDPGPAGPSDAELLARFDGDGELLRELAGIFLQECPKMLDDLRAALRAGDNKAVERAAHTLKGSVGNFAMPRPWETAQRLELLAKSGQLSGAEDILHALEQQLVLFNQILVRNTAEPTHQPR